MVYYEASLEGVILEISPSIERVSGFTRNELIGSSIQSMYIHAEEREYFRRQIAAAGRVADFELALRNKEGAIEYVSVAAQLICDENGLPGKIVGSQRVVTDRRKADLELMHYKYQLEELVRERTLDLQESNARLTAEIDARKEREQELRWSEEKYRSIIESLENGCYEADQEGCLTFFNQPLCEILGYDPEEMTGLSPYRYLDPASAQRLLEHCRDLHQTGQGSARGVYTLVRRDGIQRSAEISIALRSDKHGQVVGFRGMVQDITERLKIEQERQRVEERFQHIQRLEGIGTLAGGIAMISTTR